MTGGDPSTNKGGFNPSVEANIVTNQGMNNQYSISNWYLLKGRSEYKAWADHPTTNTFRRTLHH